ncbi:hypothetical protein [Vibrio proteolyticus]
MIKKQHQALWLGLLSSLSFMSYANHIVACDTYAAMALPNDAPLYNAPSHTGWSKGAAIVQGIPRGDAAPAYWSDAIIDKSMTTAEPWNAMTQWFTVFEAQDNQVHNVRVVVGDSDIWLLRSEDASMNPATAKWEHITPEMTPVIWAAYFSSNMVDYIRDIPYKASDTGAKEYTLSSNHYPIHGGTDIIDIDGSNVIGAFVRMKAWLIPDGPEAARTIDNAKVLISVGADYYPTRTTTVANGSFANANYLPGVADSRFRYLTKTPQWYYMGTVTPDDLSIVDNNSPLIKSGGKNYLTREEWMTNPPPVPVDQ